MVDGVLKCDEFPADMRQICCGLSGSYGHNQRQRRILDPAAV